MNAVIARIAFRNLREHTLKTSIIGGLMALGVMVFVIGTSFIDTIAAGVEESYVNNYTAHLFVAPGQLESPSLTFSRELMESPSVALPDFVALRERVVALPQVAGVATQNNGAARIKWGELGEGFTMLLGVDPASYRALFPTGVKLTAGRFLEEGESGIVLSATVANTLSDTVGRAIEVGDTIVLTGANERTGTKIRELTVRGIHDYGDAAFDIALISFTDAETVRILNGMTVAGDDAEVDPRLSGLFDAGAAGAVDALFGGGDLFGGVAAADGAGAGSAAAGGWAARVAESEAVSGAVSGTDDELAQWLGILGDLTERDRLNLTDPNAWNYLLVRLQPGADLAGTVRELNAEFAAAGVEARAWEWIDGAGMSAVLVQTLQIVLNVLLVIVAVVAVIIIMNTLVISVTERFGEIGTMRAVGAKKSFVRAMVIQETLMIAFAFGAIGIGAGAAVLAVLGAIGFEASNPFLMILLGSGVFRPGLSAGSVVMAVAVVTFVGVVSALYPMAIALRISPLAAMNRT